MTTTIVRNPLATRTLMQQTATPAPSWQTMRKVPPSKRARSPEPGGDAQGCSAKRPKAIADPVAASTRDEQKRAEKDKKRVERDNEFREKYSKAFPLWVFYFDLDTLVPAMKDKLGRRVTQMGSHVEDFFSKEVTHFITAEADEKPANKENVLKARSTQNTAGPSLASPIKFKGRAVNEGPAGLIQKALALDMKIWSAEKLISVLDRSEPVSRVPVPTAITRLPAQSANPSTASLTNLLRAERLNGTTERDPTQKRHDYVYFQKNSFFVLVEDMRQELATVIALEYPIARGRDGKERGHWPVLHCHPRARGPFVEYDEKEEKRREKIDRADHDREVERERRMARLRDYERRRKVEMQARRRTDLRRSVSMNNLRRRATFSGVGADGFYDMEAEYGGGDIEAPESANASGYLASGTYVAASGNSVGITSTTGTTSTAGLSFRNLQLPSALKDKLQNQVVTSRRVPVPLPVGKENSMGPPLSIPDRPQRILRKSRSTNTIRLPKREEGMKPGYCESCRVKFEDFKQHIYGKRHHKYATDDANFANLDSVLSRVQRRTMEEMREERGSWGISRPSPLDDPEDEDAMSEFENYTTGVPADEIRWDEWVDVDGM